MREKIVDIVLNSLEEFNAIYKQKLPLELGEETPLYGKEGVLDSLGLVSLIVMIEQELENKLEISFILADEKAMSQQTSPFLKVSLLVDYIYKLIKEEIPAWTEW